MANAGASRLTWLIPRPGEPGADLARRLQLRLGLALILANLTGATIVFAIGAWVLPSPEADEQGAVLVNLIALCAFFALVSPVANRLGRKQLRRASAWLLEDRTPTVEERVEALRGPRRIVRLHILIWSLATLIFGILNATVYSLESGQRIAITILLGGLTTCAFAYLLAERQLRPVAARALAAGAPDRRIGPGVKTRTFVAWAFGTAVPILGLMSIGLSTLVEADFTRDELAIVVLAIGGVGLMVGLYASMLSARAVADPVNSLRTAVSQVEQGELDVEVPVYDGSEIGQLQAGFNSMVAGLRERERVQDLFGRHVGEDVARAALEGDVELGGETRDVSVLFTDVIGSTEIASERPAQEVVDLLNSFFAIVVEVVDRHGGWVNKFEGDAALAIFGAPVALADAPSAALAAARELSERLGDEVDGLQATIGVSCGEVVAGNIGEESRFEYTVIGDPVNEAARLTELAKEKPGRLLASGTVLSAAGADEATHWKLDGEITLRGRKTKTELALPNSREPSRSGEAG